MDVAAISFNAAAELSRYTLYPATAPESSVEAVHDTLICVPDTAVAKSTVGTDGAVVSCGADKDGVVAQTWELFADSLPAAS